MCKPSNWDKFDESIGYDKYNGESSANTSLGKVQIDIPRDRERQFEPTIVPKYYRDISDIEYKIISIYEYGMIISEINARIEEIYGLIFSVS